MQARRMSRIDMGYFFRMAEKWEAPRGRRKLWRRKTEDGWEYRESPPEEEVLRQQEEKKQGKVSPFEGTMPWHGKEREIYVDLMGNDTDRPQAERWHKPVKDSLNHVFFEKYVSGRKAVVKSAARERKPSEVRSDQLSDNASQARREELAYEIDQIVGLHVVPPTRYAKKRVPRKFEEAPFIPEQDEDCSVQLFVSGEPIANMGKEEIQKNKGVMKCMQRIAALDLITGNTDRHGKNCLVDLESGQAYAIDNGLSFPYDSTYVRSQALALVEQGEAWDRWDNDVVIDTDQKIMELANKFDDDIVVQVAKTDEREFKKAFNDAGLEREGELAWKRLQIFVSSRKPKEPPKPEQVATYRAMKEADPADVKDLGQKIQAVYEQETGPLGSPILRDANRVNEILKNLDMETVKRNVDALKSDPDRLIHRGKLLVDESGKKENASRKGKIEDAARLYLEAARGHLLKLHKHLDVGTKVVPGVPAKPVVVPPAPAPAVPSVPAVSLAPKVEPQPKWEKFKRPVRPQKVPRQQTPEVLRVVSSDRIARELLRVAKEILGEKR